MDEIYILKDETYRIMGACFAVYNDKGNGYAEAVYQDSLEIELSYLEIPVTAQRNYPLYHRGIQLKHSYTPDLLCFEKIIVELKAVKSLTDEHRAQVLNYLKVPGLQVGLLVNLGGFPKIEWERIILSNHTQ